MLVHPEIDPVALQVGPLAVRWYGLMYLAGFAAGWWLGRLRARNPVFGWTEEEVNDLVFYIALGIVLGGRIGYVVFYGFDAWLADPLVLIRIWEGGMSFHGGLLGVLVAMALFGRRTGRPFFVVTDFIAPLIPPGLGFGRIGNFVNGELWGRATDLPWGMRFHGYGAGEFARHPSQLYEAFLEGLVLFLILWLFSARPRPVMAVSGLFLLCYGSFRVIVEFVREPDQHLGFLALDWITMGHLLSVPMLLFGALFMTLAYRKRG
jgi:phosphatidylglycerol:prolipoprotein diacylglycerol transferase